MMLWTLSRAEREAFTAHCATLTQAELYRVAKDAGAAGDTDRHTIAMAEYGARLWR